MRSTTDRRDWQRSLRGRWSAGHTAVVAAGLIAMTANLAVLRGSEGTATVVIAAQALQPGAVVTAASLDTIEVRGSATVDGLVVDADSVIGLVAASAIDAGAPLRPGDFREAASPLPGHRRVAIPVEKVRAVGGAVNPGDRIDVIRVLEGVPRYVLTDVEVLGVGDEETSFTGMSGFFITVAVDATDALCLAAALDAGDLTIVLSTGQQRVEPSDCLIAGADLAAEDAEVER